VEFLEELFNNSSDCCKSQLGVQFVEHLARILTISSQKMQAECRKTKPSSTFATATNGMSKDYSRIQPLKRAYPSLSEFCILNIIFSLSLTVG
jgi:hypothetical protein